MTLPDCRAFEQVTPHATRGYNANFAGISTDGSTLFFQSDGAIAGTGSGEGVGAERIFRADRSAAGWTTSSLTPFDGSGTPREYDFLGSSEDGSRVLFATTVSPFEAETEQGRLDDDGLYQGQVYESREGGAPLLLSHNEAGDPSTGYRIGVTSAPLFASAEGDDVVFSSASPLTAAAAEGRGPYIYEADADGEVSLVSVRSDGSVPPSGNGVELNTVSNDGARVYFSSEESYDPAAQDSGRQLFLHEASKTIDVSRSKTGVPGTAPVTFDGASANGQIVVFSDCAQLTVDDPDSEMCTEGGHDIYEYDSAEGTLTLLSTGEGGLNDGGGPVPGSIFLTMSADGSHVFFASYHPLDHNAPSEIPEDPQPSLYESANGHTTYIATLSPSDLSLLTEDPEAFAEARNGPHGAIRATADGSHLVFESDQQLTPDDHDPGRVNVYEYTEGQGLVRVSQGSLPGSGNGPYEATIGSSPRGGARSTFEIQEIPPFTYGVEGTDGRVVSENGNEVFFSSREALAAGATDGPEHVYEWDNGNTYLISPSGPQASDAQYLENSADGADVYFATTEQVLPSDANAGWITIFDARVDGGFSSSSSPSCPGDGCPVPASPARGAPLSSVFSGPGNATPSPTSTSATVSKPKPLSSAQKLAKALHACKRRRRKAERRACESTAHENYGARTDKKTHRRGK